MIPFHKIKKQLLSDPEILDHFILTEFDVIDDIKLQVIITHEENDIEIDESHKIELIGEYQKIDNENMFLDNDYPIKFDLPGKYFKKTIANI